MSKIEEAKQLQRQGVPVKEIAERIGVTLRTAYKYLHASQEEIERAKRQEQKWEKMAAGICPHSDDCFTCPLPDCAISQHRALLFNKLETD